MTSFNSDNSNDTQFVEVDGIRFETLLPQPIITLPKKGEEVTVQFGVRITNLSSTAYRFDKHRFLPEISNFRGQTVTVRGVNRNTTTEVLESDVPLVESGQSIDFLMNNAINWSSSKDLVLSGNALYSGVWSMQFQPDRYQIRLRYENQFAERKLLLTDLITYRTWTNLDSFWIGEAATPIQNITLQLID
jgi:hypothetical protein